MKKLLMFLWCMIVFALYSNAQGNNNTITLSLNSSSYDCTTGQITLSYHIANSDEFGNTQYYTQFFLETGSDHLYSSTLQEEDITWTGYYNPGDLITLRAYGIGNNAAPEVQFDYVEFGSTIPPAPHVIASPQTVLCNGGSTGLYASPSAGGVIHWSNGQTGNMISVSSPGTYYAYEVNGCGQSENSNMVVITAINNMVAPVISSSNGTSLCNGASTTLSVVSSPGGTVYWNTGQTGNSITVNTAGSYYMYVSNDCGTSVYSNTITISVGSAPPAPNIVTNTASPLCDGASAVIFVSPSPVGTVVWSNGQTGNSITVTNGSYYAYQTNSCGTSGFSNVINFSTANTPAAPSITPAGSQILCNGASLTLFSSANSIWYRDGVAFNSGPSVSVNTGGNYTATAGNICGTSSASNVIAITTGNRPAAPTVTPPGNQLLCNGQTATLSSSGSNITWSNGATGNSMVTGVAGSYYAYDRNACGNSLNSNTVLITSGVCPTPAPGTAFYICPGALKTLDAGAGYDTYVWSSGQTTRTISVGPGNYSVTVTKQGCSATSVVVSVNYYTVAVPTITPSGPTTFCAGNFVTLSSSTGSAYLWSTGGTGNTINANATGNYYVTVTDANGCTATSSPVAVTVNPLPTATVAGSATVCKDATNPVITFTGAGGIAPYTFYYKVNGGTTLSITTTSGNSATISAPTNVAGTFTYDLISVKESSSTACTNTASGSVTVVVNSLPTANISGSTTVCLNASSPIITFNGVGGASPYTFTYNINGGSNQTVTTVSGSSVSVSVPTNIAGTYTYNLLSVQESGSTTCVSTASGSATIIVKSLPVASISGNITICQNASSPSITFTGSGGTAPYLFTYKINGGIDQTVSTISGSSVTVQAPTNVAGTFTYTLVSVLEASGQTCSNSASGTVSVVVNPLPFATISGNATVCQNSGSRTITFTGSNASAPYTFTYKINGGSDQTIVSTGNTATISLPTTTSGTFVYTLVGVKETTTITACTNAMSGTATIVVNPLPPAAILTAPNTHLCNGETGQLTIANWSEGFSYAWYKDGVLLTVSSAQTLQVTLGGSYTVMAVSGEGCNAASVSNAIIITTGSISTPIITGYLKVCEGGKTKLLVTPTNTSWPYEAYRWTDTPIGDSGSIQLGNGKSFSAEAGQYRLIVKREGCVDSAVVAVTSDDTEFPAGRLTITPNKIPYGGKAVLVADVTGAATYSWDLGDSRKAVTFSNKVSENFYTRSDSVVVKVMAVSERNCATEFTASLKIGAMDTVVIPDHSKVGNLKDWNVFPLPFHDQLKLSVILRRAETVRVDLFTALGQWVRSWEFKGIKGENLFQLTNLEGLTQNVVYFITGFYNGEKHFDKIYKY